MAKVRAGEVVDLIGGGESGLSVEIYLRVGAQVAGETRGIGEVTEGPIVSFNCVSCLVGKREVLGWRGLGVWATVSNGNSARSGDAEMFAALRCDFQVPDRFGSLSKDFRGDLPPFRALLI